MSPPDTTAPVRGDASLSSILTAAQNIVVALNAATAQALAIAGAINAAALGSPTQVSIKAGRIATVSVTTAGSAGVIYDSATGGTTKPIAVIPAAVGVYPIGIPVSFGIYLVPGGGQIVTASYA